MEAGMAKGGQGAGLQWSVEDGRPARLRVDGAWLLQAAKPDLEAIWYSQRQLPAQVQVDVAVAAWDSSLLALLRRLQRLAVAQDVELRWQGLPDGVERLLQMAAKPSTQAQEAPTPAYGPVTRLGLLLLGVLALGRQLRGRGRMRRGDF